MQFACTATEDFFRLRLDHLIDLRNPLAVLASRMSWQELEASVSHLLSRKARAGVAMPDLDLFGEQLVHRKRASNAGRPRIALRVIISLLYLKHAFNESDEALVARWAETPSWQYFSGRAHFENALPCDASTLIKFRKLLGEEGVEELLAHTIKTAVQLQLIQPEALSQVIVDSTVQEKAVAYPTDSRLLETARQKLVQAAKDSHIALKQTFAKEGKELSRKAGRYAHARQFKRMRRAIKRQSTIVARLCRELQRKAAAATAALSAAAIESLEQAITKAQRIVHQSSSRKRQGDSPKLYAWHAPEVECISKGKAHQKYEFGVKVGIASTVQKNLIVGARTFAGNPYDGHTLREQLEQAGILMESLQVKPLTAVVDLGYRGVDGENPGVRIVHRGKAKSLTKAEKKLLKRRQAVEPIIGHLKQDHRMNRCHLKGATGDAIHAVLCAAGYNIQWLLRMIARKGLAFLEAVFLRLIGLLVILTNSLVEAPKGSANAHRLTIS
ncbi:IS5 family transposase [Lampropedia aestuarii]|uniref:IS5 family transposase n=1 Tax=Lampropedia aestuarii TaxID=2562762 RepID=UPI0024695502|nr:IS5 family transposase [Lampropedia aestuarii]MDH5857403.1 IS5 family transposase [Lampropedia aestuarii]